MKRHKSRMWSHKELTRLGLLSYNRELLRVLWRQVLARRADPADELYDAARRVDLRELSVMIEEADLAYDYAAIDYFLDEVVLAYRGEPGADLYLRDRAPQRLPGEAVEYRPGSTGQATVVYKRPYTVSQRNAKQITLRRLLAEKAAGERAERDREIESRKDQDNA